MTVEGRTEIRRAFLAGTTRRVQMQIVDKETSAGFQPDTLTLSIYDVEPTTGATVLFPSIYRCWHDTPTPVSVTSAIINSQNDADIIAFVDSGGNVDFYLTPEDTDMDVPAVLIARYHQRVLLFTWTWDSLVKTAKHEILLSIVPDRETVAT